jgi:uroporphyrinogen decarboxylase
MQFTRRNFALALSGAAYLTGKAQAKADLTSKQRVDRALAGKDVDIPPFSAWHHFGLEREGPEAFARATIDFHQQTGTDLIKVMSDFPYPKGSNGLSGLQVQTNPFPAQIRALEIIRDSVGSTNYFVETIFNPWSVAEKLTSRESLLQLKATDPQKLTAALEIIAHSEINHAHLALKTGASGIFLAIQNATPGVLTEDEYARFSEPFDKLILASVRSAPLNILHIHGSPIYWQHFTHGWNATGINYSSIGTQAPISELRAQFSGVILGGIDENNFPKLSADELRQQAATARQQAGKRFILTPGCSVPNDTSTASVRRLKEVYA